MPPTTDHTAGDGSRAEVPDPMIDAPALDSTANDQDLPAQAAPPFDPDVIQTDSDDDEGPPQGEEEANSAMSRCKICMDNLTPGDTIVLDCGCAYCVTCLNAHIMHGLTNRAFFPARCCGQNGIDLGNVEPYLTPDVALQWAIVESEFGERLPVYCANKECSVHIPVNLLEGEDKFVNCGGCFTDTCKECRQWHDVHTGDNSDVCPEDIVSKEDRELAIAESWKQCPGCKNLVERTEGCKNMA
jgi:hypothetical protein